MTNAAAAARYAVGQSVTLYGKTLTVTAIDSEGRAKATDGTTTYCYSIMGRGRWINIARSWVADIADIAKATS